MINEPWLSPNWETILPEWIPEEAWNAWIEMRVVKKKPITPRGRKMALNKLWGFKMEGYNLESILDRSEDSKWTGLFRHGEPSQKHLSARQHLPGVGNLVGGTRIPRRPNPQIHADKVRKQGRDELAKMKRELKLLPN